MPFMWLNSNCSEKGESQEELARIHFSEYFCIYSCAVVLQLLLERTD